MLPRIARAVIAETGCAAYNVLQNNRADAHQEVQHVHFHIIPKPSAEKGLGISWPKGSLDNEKGADLAKRIAKRVEES